jgi:hypothetical protein
VKEFGKIVWVALGPGVVHRANGGPDFLFDWVGEGNHFQNSFL